MIQQSIELPLAPDSCASRRVTTYSQKKVAEDNDFFIYCCDGQSTPFFAESLFHQPGFEQVWLIGVDNSPSQRNAEYVHSLGSPSFVQHETFFTGNVRSWAESITGIKHRPERTSVFGYSCGGAFAFSMGVRHPQLLRTTFAFSIAAWPLENPPPKPDAEMQSSVFYLRTGSREPGGMRATMKRLQKWLKPASPKINATSAPGGHDVVFWSSQFNQCVADTLTRLDA